MQEKLVPTQDEKVTSALAHAAIILPMWGIIVPAIFWATQREKSEFIKDQTLQALSWQITQVVLMFVMMACYMASFFTMFGSAFMGNPETIGGPPPGFFFPFCIMGMYFGVMAAFFISGIYAAARVLQGNVFTYPYVGSWIRRYMNEKDSASKSDPDLL